MTTLVYLVRSKPELSNLGTEPKLDVSPLHLVRPPFPQPGATSSSFPGPGTSYNKEMAGWKNSTLAATTPDLGRHPHPIRHHPPPHLPQTYLTVVNLPFRVMLGFPSQAFLGFSLLFSLPVMPDSSRPHGLQHTRLLFPSPSPKVCPSPCPNSQLPNPERSTPTQLLPGFPSSFLSPSVSKSDSVFSP